MNCYNIKHTKDCIWTHDNCSPMGKGCVMQIGRSEFGRQFTFCGNVFHVTVKCSENCKVLRMQA